MSGWKPMRQYGQTLFLIINLVDEFAKKLQAILPKQARTIQHLLLKFDEHLKVSRV